MFRRNLPACVAAGLLVLLLFGFLFSCSDDPTVVDDPTDPTGTGTIDPQNGQDVLLSTVLLGDPYRGGIEVWARNLYAPSDSIVTFDLVLVNKTNRDIFPPLHFVITQIRPNVVTVLNPDGFTPDRHPFFDFSGKLGDDGKLTPGERTGQVELRFGMPELMAFSLGFRIVVGEPEAKGAIGGVVFKDLNEDGKWDSEREPGIPEFPVELRPAAADPERTMIIRTDRSGRYRFEGLGVGVYQVTAMAAPGAKHTTENPLLVTLVELPDGTVTRFDSAHFGMSMLIPPIARIFGPVSVGPASPNGTEIDTTFVVIDPDPPLPKLYYLRIEPPMTIRYVPMWLDEAEVWLNEELIFKFDCPEDSLCYPQAVYTLIERGIKVDGENRFRARVTGNEDLMLFMSIERKNP
jgi:hypothetical protein